MTYPICPSNMPWVRAAGLHKTPHFNTITMKPAAGRGVVTASVCPYATWDFEVALSLAIGSEADSASILNAFLGLFLQCQGAARFFLFTDPQDNSVSYANSGMLNVTSGAAAPMGTTVDGTSTQFQLAGAELNVTTPVLDREKAVVSEPLTLTVMLPFRF